MWSKMIWVELSNIEVWGPQPSGIPRVAINLISQFLNIKSNRFGFFKYNIRINDYVVVDNPQELLQSAREQAFNWKVLVSGTEVLVTDVVEATDTVLFLGATWEYRNSLVFVKQLKQKKVQVGQVICDVIPMLLPQYCQAGVTEHFRSFFNEIVPLIDRFFAISESTRNDLKRLFPAVDADTISVIRLGDRLPTQGPSGDVELPAKFVLCCGTIEARKNHELLYRAWKILKKSWGGSLPALVLVGRTGWHTEALIEQIRTDSEIKNKILILSGVTDQTLPQIFMKSMFTVYPSFYEGWGLPIAESMVFGKFCICSNTSSMPEVAPGLTGLFDPSNVHAFVSQVDYYFRRPDALKEKERAIEQNYQLTDWSATASQILAKI
jgi:glycosyltransferase involved in cell wall biosynthesis